MAKNNFKNLEVKDFGLFIFRVGISYFMIKYHGLGKFQNFINGEPIQFVDPIGIGVAPSFYIAMFTEFVLSIVIILGLFTRISALLLTVNMAVASYAMLKMGNSLESPMLYCLSYLVLTIIGAGKLSLDYFIRNKK